MSDVYADVKEERARQDEQWGGPAHDDEHEEFEWILFIEHQSHKMFERRTREGFIKIAALAVAAVESMDRRNPSSGSGE